MGAVMGSKNLKDIAVRGTGKPVFQNEEEIKELARYGMQQIKEDYNVISLREYGTANTVSYNQSIGGLPTRNWLSGVFQGAENISVEKLIITILIKKESCWGCGVRCKRVVKLKSHMKLTLDMGT